MDIDCNDLTHDVLEKVLKILDYQLRTDRRNSLFYNLCGECFGEINKQISQLSITHNPKKIRKVERLASDQDNGIFTSPRAILLKSSPTAMQRRMRKMFAGSFNAPVNFSSSSLSNPDSRFSSILKHNQLNQVPAMEDLTRELEQMNLSESMMIGIAENVYSFSPVHHEAARP